MNRLFLPIRAILGQLRTMPALAAGVVLLVLLFATISWSYIDSIRARIDVVERELIGLEYSQRVRSLVMSIQERRGHLSMLSAGESGHEGVETAEQLAFLRGEGCEEAQGYLFSRPVPADEMADQLRKGCLTG